MEALALHDVAKAFPTVNFVVAHFGCGYPAELLRLGWSNANVHVDSSSNHEWTRWVPYELDQKSLFRIFHETFGPERILFGTEELFLDFAVTQGVLIGAVAELRELADDIVFT